MARAGLPVTLLSGGGEELSEVLVRTPEIGAVAFVGGRSNGGKVAAALLDSDKRHFIEPEGLNATRSPSPPTATRCPTSTSAR